MPRFLRGRLIAAAVALPLIASACTTNTASTGSAAVTVTTDSTIAGSTAALNTQTQPAQPPAGSSGAAPTATTDPSVLVSASASASSSSTAAASSTAPTTPTAKPVITTAPADGATGSSPIAPVTAAARNGTFTNVSLTNPEGKAVAGTLSADKKRWTSAEPLGYGRRYTLTSTAAAPGGQTVRATSSFTTLAPTQTIYPSFFPNPNLKTDGNPNLKTVGVGQPMVVIFDKPPADKAAAQRALSVKTVPAVTGSWFWWDDRTVHYRAKDYWRPVPRSPSRRRSTG